MPVHYPARRISKAWLRWGLGLALLLGSSGLALATVLQLFIATYDGSLVQVEWAVGTETDLTGFDLSRKAPQDSDFVQLAYMLPTGQRHYTFADSTLDRSHSGLLPGPVLYRLRLRGPGPGQAYTTAVAGTTSAVQRSWGTVKAMFR